MATVADIRQPWLSGQNQIDALLWQTFHWQYHTPADPAIYYTFSTTEGNETGGFDITTDLTPFNSAQQAAARQAVANAAAVTGIEFIEVANGELADIHFANAHITIPARAATEGSISWSHFPDKILLSYEAEAWIYLDSDEHRDLFVDPSPGTAGYQILLHELGHALALKHPHEGDISLSAAQDNTGNTVMSFNWVSTPQVEFQELDVAALQWWYGTDGVGGASYGGTTTAVVSGTAGADSLIGGAGSDTLSGGAGNDTVIGGAGNDVVDGGAGVDSLDGGLGGDVYFVSAGDVLTDAGGIDTVVAEISWTLAPGFEDLWLGSNALPLEGYGNSLANIIWGNDGSNLLKGAGGNDEIYDVGEGNDTLAGGSGNDLLVGFSGDEVFLFEEAPGAANADLVLNFGFGDKIHLHGSAHLNIGPAGAFASGDARFFAGPGASSGQDASDRVVYDTSAGELWYDADGNGGGSAELIARLSDMPALAASDIIVVSAANPGVVVNGTSGNDTLSGTSGDDTLNGLGGNDTLVGSGGTDFYDGGTGFDSLELKPALSGVTVKFSTGTLSGGFSGTFVNMERVLATASADSLIGAAGAQNLSGRGGADTLEGGAGIDTLWGGSEADHFVFREFGTTNADGLSDFASSTDKIVLDGSVMAALGASGNFTAGDDRFVFNSAQDAEDRIIYNTTTRQIFYDADGNGSGGAVLIATLQSGATLAATDIVVEGGSAPGGGQTTNGTPGNDSLVGGPGNDAMDGLGGDDTLVGLGGDDTLVGGAGFDSMDGGAGNDTYVTESIADEFGNGNDSISDLGGIDTIIVEGNGGWLRSGSGIENLTIRGYSEAQGGAGATGNELNNVIRDEGPGNGFLDGQGGNDTLIGNDATQFFSFSGNYTPGVGYDDNYGNDVVDGGGGTDWLNLEDKPVAVTVDFRNGTVIGGSPVGPIATFVNVEIAQGTLFDDVMFASDSGNILRGYGGGDTLIGGAGADAMSGDDGWDHSTTGPGNDRLLGGGGNDEIAGEEGDDWIDGGAGNDALVGDWNDGAGADSFAFSVAPGAANADAIGDFVSALDRIVLDGSAHPGSGPSGRFTAGDARFWSSTTGMAHDADDRVIYDTDSGELWYDADGNAAGGRLLIATLEGAPSLAATDIEIINGSTTPPPPPPPGGQVINGTSANDTLTGTAGNDTINGLGGNDLFLAGSTGGADVIDGGTGFDSVEFKERATSAMVVDFGTGSISGGSSGTISFSNVERVLTGNFNDSLTGNASSQTLTGQSGADTLWGAGAADTLWGGAGGDTFIFRETGTANADSIRDWTSGSDTLALDNAAMTALGAEGDFVANDARFASGAGFTSGRDPSDRVVFDTSTGRLYYDADGSATVAVVQLIGTVQSGASVAAADITVI